MEEEEGADSAVAWLDLAHSKVSRRGRKVSNASEAIDAQRQVLQAERPVNSKTVSTATWNASLQMARVVTPRGGHFMTLGRHISGALHLYPEELLYLVERGTLILLLPDPDSGAPRVATLPQVVSLVQSTDLARQRYLVYAHLKRLGFIIVRDLPPPPVQDQATTEPAQDSAFTWIMNWLSRLVGWSDTAANTAVEVAPPSAAADSPLPLWRMPPRDGLSLLRSRGPAERTRAMPEQGSAIDFWVYRPRASYSKRAPGTPHFAVVVRGYHDEMDFTARGMDRALGEAASAGGGVALKLAVVDSGIVSLFNISSAVLPDLWQEQAQEPRKKRRTAAPAAEANDQ